MTEFETQSTTELVCPHCGYTNDDSHNCFAVGETETVLTCDECGESFVAIRDFEVIYTTRPVSAGQFWCMVCGGEFPHDARMVEGDKVYNYCGNCEGIRRFERVVREPETGTERRS